LAQLPDRLPRVVSTRHGQFRPLLDAGERLSRMWSPVSHLNAVMDSPDLRATYERCLPKLSAYQTEVAQNEKLFAAFQTIHEGPAFTTFDAARRRVVTNALRDFRLSGVALPPAEKARFKEIAQELAQLSNCFEQNTLDATHAFKLYLTDPRDLEGLPPSALALARQIAQREGRDGCVITLDYPSYFPFMSHARRRDLRERLYEAYATRASELGPDAGKHDNTSSMRRIVDLRHEAALLLGYANAAQVSLVPKMAKSPEQVVAFLEDLARRVRPWAVRELDQLRAFALERDGLSELSAWDIPYYAEQLRRSLYKFSDEDTRPYFPLERVLSGMFEVAQRLFGVRIAPAPAPEVWHPDVRFFAVFGTEGERLGQFYGDFLVREHKRGGAWMDDCVSRKHSATGVQTPVAYLTCNFTPPVDGKPALLTHEEVVTLFHEFGHGLHHLLTQVDFVAVSGINGVAWDAVELPSQFMENFCWGEESLALISGHYESGEPLPEALLSALRGARNFQSGMQTLRQIELALFDMRLHTGSPPVENVQNLAGEVRRQIAVVFPPAYNRYANTFAHIFAGGYAAGYYSYKWAEVLSADAFSRFEEEGLFNALVGKSFLDNILATGGVPDPAEAFRAFRGRDPSLEPLLRQSGLLEPAGATNKLTAECR
jgi:oligopeptidase A